MAILMLDDLTLAEIARDFLDHNFPYARWR
jgi:hypothetical protein